MASTCISSCVDDTRVPVRATYVNLYKWPESDAEFVRSVSSNISKGGGCHGYCGHPRVVDSISCRQLYLRSYKFSREESMPEKTVKCLGRVKERVVVHGKKKKPGGSGGGRRRETSRCGTVRRVKEVSCAALVSVFQRLLSCTTKIDVVG